jgi:hypothetical protein
MISDLRYSQIIYKHFKNSPHSRLYDFVFDLDFENFVEKDIAEIKRQAGDQKKCIIINGSMEPHWYDHGSRLSAQFRNFLQILKKHMVFNTDFFVPCFGDMYKDDLDVMNDNHHGWNFMRFHIDIPYCPDSAFTMPTANISQDLQIDMISNNFHYMNFTKRMHRNLFSKFIIENGLDRTNCVAINTYLMPGYSQTNEEGEITQSAHSGCIEVRQNDDWNLDKTLTRLWRDVALKQVNHPDIDQDFIRAKYGFIKKSGVYVVSESVFHHPYPYFTEKTMSALLSQRPFVVIGPHGSLNALRQKGFKTFDDIFDESYDKIRDPSARMTAVFDLVKEISTRSLDEIKQNVLQCKNKINHNNKIMIERIEAHK